MTFIRLIYLGFYLLVSTLSYADQAYLNRFNAYQAWSNQLPTTPNPAFLTFISQKAPLSQKLREQWLYALAQQQHWDTYLNYYQPSNDSSLVCYKNFALYQQGQQNIAIANSKKQWLTGDSLPPACDKLFILMINENIFDNELITKRIKLALEKRNAPLASYLLRKIKHTTTNHDEKTFEIIQQNPTRITQLKTGGLNSDFYLYGLKRLLSRNLDHATRLWQQAQQQGLLNEKQQQDFLAQIAIQKAVRDQQDASTWLQKIKPFYMNETLLEWKIRFALKNRRWANVESLIKQSTNRNSACWQYWLARALDAQGKHADAVVIYQTLAKTRQYYGFLASNRLNMPFQFAHENMTIDKKTLDVYKPITNDIKKLYQSKQTLAASKLTNNFFSELPKNEKIAFINWLEHDLHWVGKAVYLSNHEDLTNQLTLRFPLAYQQDIKQQSTHYHVPEALVYAIIRQESAFREDVISFAGAHGLMQLMPSTAKWISKLHHIPYQDKKQLFTSFKNIHLGVAYLQQLAKHFHNHPLFMVAAYNAGPKQVNHWLQSQPHEQSDIWIETIPYYETRNYLKSVMSFYLVYQYRLGQKPSLSDFTKH
jgi:soluble lytic murein transglycosylase